MGPYALPHADKYELSQLRRDLGIQLGVDPDRDWKGGVLTRVNEDNVSDLELFKQPWHQRVSAGRTLFATLTLVGLLALLGVLL